MLTTKSEEFRALFAESFDASTLGQPSMESMGGAVNEADLQSAFEELEEWESSMESFIHDELDELSRCEDRFLDIASKLDSIRQEDGVCRRHVVGLEDALPSHVPLASFTERPTHTNLNETVVSLENFLWDALKAVAKAIGDLIRKIVGWITGDSGEEVSTKKEVKETEEVTEAAEKKAKSDSKKPPESEEEVELREFLKTSGEEWSRIWNAYTEQCFLSPDSYIQDLFSVQDKIFEGLLNAVLEYEPHFEKILENFQKGRESDDPAHYSASNAHAESYVQLLSKHTERIYKEVESSISRSMGSNPGLDEIVSGLKERRRELQSEKPGFNPDPERFLEEMIAVASKNGVSMSEKMKRVNPRKYFEEGRDKKNLARDFKKLESMANKVQEDIESISSQGLEGSAATVARSIRLMLTQTQKSIQGILSYHQLQQHAIRTEYRLLKKYRNHAKRYSTLKEVKSS